MDKLKIGDRIDCLVKESVIVHPYKLEYDEVITLEIIAIETAGYHLYVPGYRFLKNSKTLDASTGKKLKIKTCFVGEQVVMISDNLIFQINTIYDGCFCSRCHDFFNMAAPNQENGTMVCWICKNHTYNYQYK